MPPQPQLPSLPQPAFDPRFAPKPMTQLVPGSGPAFNAGGVGFPGWQKLVICPPFEWLSEPGLFTEQWSNDGTLEVKARLKTPWSTRKILVDQFMGFSDTFQPQGGGAPLLTRTIPMQCPEVGYQHLYCSDMKLVQGVGEAGFSGSVFATNHGIPLNNIPLPNGPGGPVIVPSALPGGSQQPIPWPAYFDGTPALNTQDGLAIYDVIFTAPQPVYIIRNDLELAQMASTASVLELERYVSWSKQSSVQGVPLPAGTVVFTAGPNNGKPIPDPAAFLYLHTVALQYTWYQIPDEPATAILACTGKVNGTTFDGARGRRSYAPGTLLCQAPLKVESKRHTTGRVYWQVTYSFLYRQFSNIYLPNTILGWSALPSSDGNYWPVGFLTSTATVTNLAVFLLTQAGIPVGTANNLATVTITAIQQIPPPPNRAQAVAVGGQILTGVLPVGVPAPLAADIAGKIFDALNAPPAPLYPQADFNQLFTATPAVVYQ